MAGGSRQEHDDYRRAHLDEGNDKGAKGNRAEVVSDDVPDGAENGVSKVPLVSGKVPRRHHAGDGDVLAPDDELGHPEQPEQVVPPHSVERLLRVVRHVTKLVDGRVARRGQEHVHHHPVGEKGKEDDGRHERHEQYPRDAGNTLAGLLENCDDKGNVTAQRRENDGH